MDRLKQLIDRDSLGGILLILATVSALIASNSFLRPIYLDFLDIPFMIKFADFEIDKPMFLWINDGLMSVFFFMIGLELKREALVGELREWHKVIAPGAAALGGIVVPILIYYWFTHENPTHLAGWAIPMATDIAFVVGILSLFTKRVPMRMKVFLLTLAVIDDIAAIIVIAVFHTRDLSFISMAIAFACIMIFIMFHIRKVDRLTPYIVIGLVLWLSVLKSGVHATLSGVIVAMFIPMVDRNGESILEKLERDLRPTVGLIIIPLFAFANSGVFLGELPAGSLMHPVTLGICLGLLVGKPVGVIVFTKLYEWIAKINSGLSFVQLITVGMLAGIGFTMSLFIAGLSFYEKHQLLNLGRMGILLGTFAAISLSTVMLATLPLKTKQQ